MESLTERSLKPPDHVVLDNTAKLCGKHCRKSRNCAARRVSGLAHGLPTPTSLPLVQQN